MLNSIWPFFIIISFIFAIFTGNMSNLNNSIFTSCTNAVQLTIQLFGTMCLWNGLMKIVQETSLMRKLTKFIEPLMKILFPKMRREDKEYKDLGADYYNQFNTEKKANSYIKKLKELGYDVQINAQAS